MAAELIKLVYVDPDNLGSEHPEMEAPMLRVGALVVDLLANGGIGYQQLANIFFNFHVQCFATLNPTDSQIAQAARIFAAHVTEVRDLAGAANSNDPH